MSKPSRPSHRRTEQEHREILDRFRRSGLTRRAFCRQEGISLNSLHRWQKRYEQSAAPFVDVTPPPATFAAPSGAASALVVELQFPNGCVLRLRG